MRYTVHQERQKPKYRIGHIKTFLAVGLLALPVAAALNFGTAGAATLTVDDNGLDCPGAPYTTIQAAVNAAAPSDDITVCAGEYNENVLVNKSVTINGAQAGNAVSGRSFGAATESTVEGVNDTAGVAVFTVAAADVTIDGFSITNAVTTGAAFGVTVNGTGASAELTNNLFDAITTAGTDGQATAQAIYLLNGPDGVEILDNSINTVTSDRSAKGVLLGDNGAANAPDNTSIEGNVITNVTSITRGAYGVSVAAITGGTDGLLIQDNEMSDLIGGGWAHAIGLEGDTPGAFVTRNDISNIADLTPTTVNSAQVFDAVAVFFQSNPSIASVRVNENSLEVGANNYGIALHPTLLATAGTAQVDGECNWWGSASGPGPVGPGTGSRVTNNVDFQPWLLTEGGSCIGGNVATNKDQCKNGGWSTRTDSDNKPFANQGDCVSYVATKGKNKANG